MNAFTPEQQRRFDEVYLLAKRMGNVSLTMIQRFSNPYRDLTAGRLKEVEEEIREAFVSAILEEETPVLIWARNCEVKSFEFARKVSGRGKLVRLLAKKQWFNDNWGFFTDDHGKNGRRCIFVFLRYDQGSLSRLVAPWWDPAVVTNPSVASSPSLVREAKARVERGVIAFSLGLKGLRNCEISFHPDDIEVVPQCVCRSVQKGPWWEGLFKTR